MPSLAPLMMLAHAALNLRATLNTFHQALHLAVASLLEPDLKGEAARVCLRVPSTLSWCSWGSLRRPAVPNKKIGVLDHFRLGTTASPHSNKGERAFSTRPVLPLVTTPNQLLHLVAGRQQTCRNDRLQRWVCICCKPFGSLM